MPSFAHVIDLSQTGSVHAEINGLALLLTPAHSKVSLHEAFKPAADDETASAGQHQGL
jgi:hypothetical protein